MRATVSLQARGVSLERLMWRLDTPAGLLVMFSAALLLRIAIAPHLGFFIDLRFFRTWATELRDVGTQGFYEADPIADYPPGYLYILWLIGKISASPGYLLLKTPALIGDLALAWIAGTFAARLAPSSMTQRVPVRAVVAAAVLFNPAVIALSAGWGQVDVVPVSFVLASLLLLFTGVPSLRREIAAFLLIGIAFSMKPQTCLVLPVMVYALYRRYLHHRPRPDLIDGGLSIALCGALSLCVWIASGLAFGLSPVELVRFYRESASVADVTSANAFNFWGVVAFWRNDASGDDVFTVAGIPALYVGLLLLVAATGFVLWHAHRAIGRGADETRVLLVAGAVQSLLAFTVLTRMHERYLFLTLACLAPLVFARQFRFTYAALSALFLFNLWYPYSGFNTREGVEALRFQPWFDWIYGGFATDPWQKKAWSLAVVAVALLMAWRSLRWLEQLSPRAPAVAQPWPALDLRRIRHLPSAAAPLDDAADALSARRFARWVPLSLAGLTALFGLVVLRGETKAAENLNDSSFHLQMVRWASGQIDDGRVPFDGWFPYFALGSSFFHHYQSLPHTVSAFVVNLTGAGAQTIYLWILYLLVSLWPIAVYAGARLMDWSRWTAAAAAAISPLVVSTPGYGYEHGSYTWQGYGIYGQLWAMWLLPIAWGLTWRAVVRGKYYAAAAVALALTIACHFITGYLALLTVGVWVIVVGAGFVHRVGRAALAAGGSLLIASWVLVPLIGDIKWTAQTQYYKGSIFNDSHGAQKVLGWLFTGEIFDAERFPIITLLFFAGVVVCLARVRKDVRARALLGAFTLSLLLFFGRPTLGPVLDLLPGFRDVQIHRFIMGVHLAGILLAGVGLGWLLRTAYSVGVRRSSGSHAVSAAASVLLCIALLAPAWTERARYDDEGEKLIRSQQEYDATDGRDLDRLIEVVQSRHDGRVYAGNRANWGQQYRVGSVPLHAWLADRGVDALGFVFRTITSLSTDIEVAFDETNPAQYEMLNIRYLILPPGRNPPVPARLLASSGRHRLFQVRTSGYFQVVDRAPSVSADRKNIELPTRAFRESNLASRGIYPGVAFAGADAIPSTFVGPEPPPGKAGSVLTQSYTLEDGVFSATVDARRPSVVLLKATYDPRWTVTVDGRREEPTMMAPSLVGVEVPTGRHEVRFRYEPFSWYPLLLAVGAATLLALVLVPRRAALRRRLKRFRGRAQAQQAADARDA